MRLVEGDLTAKARIRDAALHLFGREGYAAASVRAVATLAGVSPALVVHHFESKDGLRAACDEYVVSQFLGRNVELAGGDPAMAMQRWLEDVETYRPLIDYTARMLTSNTPAADELFDALRAGTAAMVDEHVASGIMREPVDRSIISLYLTLYGLVPLVMHHQVARALGTAQLSAEGIRRSAVPILDLYTHGLYTDERFLVGAREALARTSGPRSDKGENDPNQDPDPPRGTDS